MALDVPYTAHTKAMGGRNDHTQAKDGQVSHDLSVPEVMDGPSEPNTTIPEDLSTAGYVACFGPAYDSVAKSVPKPDPSNIGIHCDAGIDTREEGGFGLRAGPAARISDLSQADAKELAAQAYQVCPYSNATRSNMGVTLKTEVVRCCGGLLLVYC